MWKTRLRISTKFAEEELHCKHATDQDLLQSYGNKHSTIHAELNLRLRKRLHSDLKRLQGKVGLARVLTTSGKSTKAKPRETPEFRSFITRTCLSGPQSAYPQNFNKLVFFKRTAHNITASTSLCSLDNCADTKCSMTATCELSKTAPL